MARKVRQRANGEGTVITLRKNRKILGYVAEITVSWKDGKRQKVRSPRYKERTAAEAALIQLRKQHAQGIHFSDGTEPLRTHLAEWLGGITPHRRPRTIATYQWAIDQHINPHIGDLALQQVRPQAIRKLFNLLVAKELKASSIGLVRTVLRQTFQQAVEDELIEYNPADRAKPPQVKKGQVGKALTIDQIAALLDAARGMPLEVALRLCFSFGLRRGEVCGLRWKDIDFAQGTVTIRGTLGLVKGQGLIWGETKSENGLRSFKLPASLLSLLTYLKTQHDIERAMKGSTWDAIKSDDAAYVFVSPRNGGPLNPARLYDAFKDACKIAGLESYRLHDLRHSAASYLHAQRAPKKTISTFMGHASTRITDDIYTHLFQDELNDAANQIEVGLEAALARYQKR